MASPPVSAKAGWARYTFRDGESFVLHPAFRTFTSVTFSSSWPCTHLPTLPPRLQVLVVNGTRVTELPPLPDTMREVHAGKNRIESLPDMSECDDLELLDLRDNCLVSVDATQLPQNVRTLNLAFNKMVRIVGPCPDSLAFLDCSYNQFEEHPFTPLGCQVDERHMWNEDVRMARQRAMMPPPVVDLPVGQALTYRPLPPPTPPTDQAPTGQALTYRPPPPPTQPEIYDNKQNVHAPSVQATVSASVREIMARCGDSVMSEAYVDEVLALWGGGPLKRLLRFSVWLLVGRGRYRRPWTPPIREWCECDLVHSTHGITFGHLLQMVWTLIQTHEHADTLRAVLKDELEASVGYCFTGRFTRLINVLTGFVDGVGVGISDKEQMQSRIAAVVRGGGDDVRAKVEAILDEFEVRDHGDRAAWLDAL